MTRINIFNHHYMHYKHMLIFIVVSIYNFFNVRNDCGDMFQSVGAPVSVLANICAQKKRELT